MILGVNPRYLLLDPRYNPKGITFEQYFTDPEIMFHVQLEFQDFVRHHMWADHEMGVPEEGWSITVDFQNVYESAWLGAPVVFRDGNCPACAPYPASRSALAISADAGETRSQQIAHASRSIPGRRAGEMRSMETRDFRPLRK